MTHLKRIIRLCALALFMGLAIAGIGIFGVAPILGKDRKLFPDIELVTEVKETTASEMTGQEVQNFKF